MKYQEWAKVEQTQKLSRRTRRQISADDYNVVVECKSVLLSMAEPFYDPRSL